MAGRRDYGFVRSYASLGRDLDDIQKFIAAGYGGVLLKGDDPYLAQAVNDLRNAGISYGIWEDPNVVNNNAHQYALRMAQLYGQYRPDLMVPDLEFVAKGYEGSPGWNWSQQLANYWQQYLPGVRTAITPMGNQKDFNYEAWTPMGVEWLPQAYGADSNMTAFDPEQVVRTLIERGVDPSLISPVLSPAHQQGYGGAGMYTIDDFIGRDIPKAQGPATRPQATGGSDARTTSTKKSRYNGPPVLGEGASQSRSAVEQGGLHWGGQTFKSQKDFSRYLTSRGRSYATWAQQHQPAAQGLAARSPNARPRS